MRLAAVVALLVASLAPARARAEPLRVGLLPTTSPRAAGLRATLDAVAKLVAPSAAALPSFALAPAVTRADVLLSAGRLDEAASLFDVAIDEGVRAPLAVADPAALVHAHLMRATIGLARGETDRAESLLMRLLRWDPTFAPAAADATPRLTATLERVRARLGPRPPLAPTDAGDACTGETLAMRPLADGGELFRLDHCRVVATTLARHAAAPAALASALGWAPAVPPKKRPVYRRAWFWATLGSAVLVAGGAAAVGAWAATRSDQWHVTPHL